MGCVEGGVDAEAFARMAWGKTAPSRLAEGKGGLVPGPCRVACKGSGLGSGQDEEANRKAGCARGRGKVREGTGSWQWGISSISSGLGDSSTGTADLGLGPNRRCSQMDAGEGLGFGVLWEGALG
jgi:hypothetical protein